jgi:hypothetical protein
LPPSHTGWSCGLHAVCDAADPLEAALLFMQYSACFVFVL